MASEFDNFLKLMVHKGGSDIFVTAGVPIMMKVHGKVSPVAKATLTPQQSMQLVLSIMNEKQRAEFLDTHECNFAIQRAGIGRFRVNAFQQRNSAGMVLRKIETTIPTFDKLKLPEVLKEVCMTKRGLVILVGGTGSGKSTSLAAMIDYRNTNSTGHIITVEDPIEYVHEHKGNIITQREVGVDTFTFEAALVNTLRQAPDVILLGEIRTMETMEHAIAFAETGHLAMATLHANNANQALDRIVNFFPDERKKQLLMDLSFNLKAVISQRLVRTPDGQGRRAAIEIMLNTPMIADLILKGEIHSLKEVMAKSNEAGMVTFDQALYRLFVAGQITLDEALRNADSANEVRLMAKLGEEDAAEKMKEATAGLTLEMHDDDR